MEHRLPDAGTRSAVVHAGRFFSLLFLNNNLHHTHHARLGVPWYELPRLHARLDAAAGARLYSGFGEIAPRYLFRPFDRLVVPSAPPAVPSADLGEDGSRSATRSASQPTFPVDSARVFHRRQ